MSPTIEEILAKDYLGDLEGLDLDVLRDRRRVCTEIETGLSYLRRQVQGRLDVLAAEGARRVDGGTGEDLADLIARLPALLATSTRTPGPGRLPRSLGTGVGATALAHELDQIIARRRLTSPGQLSEAGLASARDELDSFERRVSSLRRSLFDRIDAIEAELTRRYRTGEASVDSLLG